MTSAMVDPKTHTPFSEAGTRQQTPPEATIGSAGLEALRSRLGRLLLADPVTNDDPETAERIARRAQQIRAYLGTARTTVAAPGPVGIGAGSRAVGMETPGHPTDPRDQTRTIQTETARLIAALDAYLADPASATLRAALEQTIEEVIGPLPEPQASLAGPERPKRPSNAIGSHRLPHAESTPRVELHRLDEAERDWWHNRFEQLRRRVTVGLVLSAAAIIGLLALYLDSGHPWPSSEMPPDMRQPGSAPASLMPMAPPGVPTDTLASNLPSGMDALYQLLRQLGTTPEGLAAFVRDWSDGPAATLEALRERNAELDLKIMQLDARLTAWESIQPSASASRAEQTDGLDLSQPAFGIQLATLRSREDTLAFARRSGLDLANLYIETAGKNQMLILGFYPSADLARSALAALPAALQKSRPIVRSFQAPADLSAVEN